LITNTQEMVFDYPGYEEPHNFTASFCNVIMSAFKTFDRKKIVWQEWRISR